MRAAGAAAGHASTAEVEGAVARTAASSLHGRASAGCANCPPGRRPPDCGRVPPTPAGPSVGVPPAVPVPSAGLPLAVLAGARRRDGFVLIEILLLLIVLVGTSAIPVDREDRLALRPCPWRSASSPRPRSPWAAPASPTRSPRGRSSARATGRRSSGRRGRSPRTAAAVRRRSPPSRSRRRPAHHELARVHLADRGEDDPPRRVGVQRPAVDRAVA